MVLGIGIPTMGIAEWIIILVIVFLLFGAKRLPEIGKGIGEGIKNFRGAMKKEDDKDLQKPTEKEAS
ncbi:MAG: twin-arginine translocase TatA/TatE family subunit [Acidobacteria bacterium]|nr:twin-arginine translocase TatA/TatE family subunit [Acidobacteriota bacterium]